MFKRSLFVGLTLSLATSGLATIGHIDTGGRVVYSDSSLALAASSATQGDISVTLKTSKLVSGLTGKPFFIEIVNGGKYAAKDVTVTFDVNELTGIQVNPPDRVSCHDNSEDIGKRVCSLDDVQANQVSGDLALFLTPLKKFLGAAGKLSVTVEWRTEATGEQLQSATVSVDVFVVENAVDYGVVVVPLEKLIPDVPTTLEGSVYNYGSLPGKGFAMRVDLPEGAEFAGPPSGVKTSALSENLRTMTCEVTQKVERDGIESGGNANELVLGRDEYFDLGGLNLGVRALRNAPRDTCLQPASITVSEVGVGTEVGSDVTADADLVDNGSRFTVKTGTWEVPTGPEKPTDPTGPEKPTDPQIPTTPTDPQAPSQNQNPTEDNDSSASGFSLAHVVVGAGIMLVASVVLPVVWKWVTGS